MNPPCNSSLSTSFNKGTSSEEEIEVGRISFFAKPHEIVEEGALEVDDGVVE